MMASGSKVDRSNSQVPLRRLLPAYHDEITTPYSASWHSVSRARAILMNIVTFHVEFSNLLSARSSIHVLAGHIATSVIVLETVLKLVEFVRPNAIRIKASAYIEVC